MLGISHVWDHLVLLRDKVNKCKDRIERMGETSFLNPRSQETINTIGFGNYDFGNVKRRSNQEKITKGERFKLINKSS